MYISFNFSGISDNAVTVEAVVVEHVKKESTELGASYYSYVSYTYEGKKYEKIEYQEVSSEGDLADIGETVFVKVNPEDPEVLLGTLFKNAWFGALFCGLALFIALTCWINETLLERTTKQPIETIDEQTAEKYIKQKIKLNCKRKVSFVITIWLLTLGLLFPRLFDNLLSVAVFPAIYFLFLLTKDIYNLVNAKKTGYKICTGKYSHKIIRTTDGTEYCLLYYFDELSYKLEILTSYDNFMNILETDKAYLVYYNHNKKSPAVEFYSIGNKLLVNWDC